MRSLKCPICGNTEMFTIQRGGALTRGLTSAMAASVLINLLGGSPLVTLLGGIGGLILGVVEGYRLQSYCSKCNHVIK